MTSDEPETDPTVPRKTPRYKAADKAQAPIQDKPPNNSPTKLVPVDKPDGGALSILPLSEMVESSVVACGVRGSKGGYFNSGFYQDGNSFSRSNGLSAARQFCDQLSKNGSVLGPGGSKFLSRPIPEKGAQEHSALMCYEDIANHIFAAYDSKNSGRITVRAIYDIDNRIAGPMKEKDCNKNGDNGGPMLFVMDKNFCITRGSQPVEFCDVEKKDTNASSAKHGRVFYRKCATLLGKSSKRRLEAIAEARFPSRLLPNFCDSPVLS